CARTPSAYSNYPDYW
nr:immunoglobulin heavy chain junction region [Macaca mulatta]MOV41977.1 immunoglobulin heavy chain junction region [Macaca mulatta]